MKRKVIGIIALTACLLTGCTISGGSSSTSPTKPTSSSSPSSTFSSPTSVIDDGIMRSRDNKVYPIGTKDRPFSTGVCTSLNIYLLEMTVEYGDSILVKCGTASKDTDFTMLIDVGTSGDGSDSVKPAIKTYANNEIDFAVFTHAHADHIKGFKNSISKNVDTVTIKNFLDFGYKYVSDPKKPTTTYEDYYEKYRDEYIKEKKANYCTAYDAVNNRVCSSKYYLAQDFTFEVLNTGEYVTDPATVVNNNGANDTSIAGILRYKDFSMFLSGDLDREDSLLKNNPNLPQVDVMKGGHHGSDTSNSVALLNKLKPDNIVISDAAVKVCKEKNEKNECISYSTDGRANDHPNYKAVTNMLNSTAGNNIYCNMTMGTININVDPSNSTYNITGLGANKLVYEDKSINQRLEANAKLVDTYFYNSIVITKHGKTMKDLIEGN